MEVTRNLDTYFADIPYDLKAQNENNFHNVLVPLP